MLGNLSRILPTSLASWSSLNAEGGNLADSARRVGAAGQPITDFTDIIDSTDFTECWSRENRKKSEIGKVRKLSDAAFCVAAHVSDGSGSARREARGGATG